MKKSISRSILTCSLLACLCLGLAGCTSTKKRATRAATVGAVSVGTSKVVKNQAKDKTPSVRDNDRGRKDR